MQIDTSYSAVEDQLLLLLKLQDSLFNGVLDDESSGEDGLELSDTMGAVDRLHLRGRIPPWIWNRLGQVRLAEYSIN